jgi:hypothetical protein
MDSTARLMDLDTERETEFTLVFPDDADPDQNKISVLAPIGCAMLGYREGDEFEWETPEGNRRLRVVKVINQPQRLDPNAVADSARTMEEQPYPNGAIRLTAMNLPTVKKLVQRHRKGVTTAWVMMLRNGTATGRVSTRAPMMKAQASPIFLADLRISSKAKAVYGENLPNDFHFKTGAHAAHEPDRALLIGESPRWWRLVIGAIAW